MDEITDLEVTTLTDIDRTRFQTKDSGFSLNPGTSNMLELQEMVIPGDINVQELDGKNINRVGTSEHACASPRYLDNGGAMVEELTVRSNDSGNLTIVGASTMRDKKQNNWQHLYSGSAFFPEFLDKQHEDDAIDHSIRDEKQPVSCNTLLSPGGIRTKILSSSGVSEYFVKNTLKGKGVIYRGPTRDVIDSNTSPISIKETPMCPSDVMVEPRPSHGSVSLREWLKAGRNKVDKSKSLYIFKQILDLVDSSHSRGVAFQALRPSCFKLLQSNQVLYLGSPAQKEFIENVGDKELYLSENDGDEKRQLEHGVLVAASQGSKKRKFGDHRNSFSRWPQFPIRSGFKYGNAHDNKVGSIRSTRDSGYGFNEENVPARDNTPQMLSTVGGDPLEEQWYASPEDRRGRCSTLSSNIYSLGVLLYELLGSFESGRAHAIAMKDLRQRILSPSFLSENPKEAGFCLWLLHPEASLRPTTREILQSGLVSGIQESSVEDLSSSIDQEEAESELLLHFLASSQEQKQNSAAKLVEDIRCLESDIAEVMLRRTNNSLTLSGQQKQPHESKGTFLNQESQSTSRVNESRLLSNIKQLESAYFSVRSSIQVADSDTIAHEVLRSRANNQKAKKIEAENKPIDRLGVFFNGLCKYARYSKFEVRGTLRNGDFSSSANVICSLGFDRDEDYFATAGVSKKIKVYDFHALLNDSVDIHYPAVEMSNKSKLSCICWNSYIRNYLASTDYDGVVKLWDAGSGQAVSHHIEHERRAWSVDFSRVDPTKLASGSDDCSVKLWSINEKKSLSTIRNIANVCCVQFSPYSTHLLSFGSADYRTYCYDLRKISTPLCILAGHDRAVSYVKFLDSETLISASTDNTLKLWDLNKTTFGALSTSGCISTFKGHTNEKNFVGLSVADGYIACGSETNEVYAYHRSLPMPITSHKFGSIDPISGKETENENNQFVSSVCWRQKSEMVVAANSSGSLKLLQMV